MGNAFYDINLSNGKVLPYVGAGLGYATVNSHVEGTAADQADITHNAKSGTFAYQAMVGASFKVNKMLSLFAEYKFFGTSKAQFLKETIAATAEPVAEATTKEYKHAIFTHNANIGIKFKLS